MAIKKVWIEEGCSVMISDKLFKSLNKRRLKSSDSEFSDQST